jgi:hypothetical protein
VVAHRPMHHLTRHWAASVLKLDYLHNLRRWSEALDNRDRDDMKGTPKR